MMVDGTSPAVVPTMADVLIGYLKLEGVSHVFGLPGAANANTLLALGRTRQPPDPDPIDFVICRHETGAAYMADGYARVTGGIATVLVTAGPGAMNALTGAVNAHESRTPMMIISGEVSQAYYGKAFLQEGVDADLNVDGVYTNACRYSAVVSAPENFVELLTTALREARSLPGGATHLSLPDNIMGVQLTTLKAPPTVPASSGSYRVQPVASDPATMSAIFDGLTSDAYPLVFLGEGARSALTDPQRLAGFTALVERFALPVMTSPDGKGIFPEGHELSLRNFGMAQCEWPIYYLKPNLLDPQRPARFGAILVLGSELGELATMASTSDTGDPHYTADIVPTGMFAHVEANQSIIGREYPISLGLVAQAEHAIDQLIAAGAARVDVPASAADRRAFIARIKAEKAPVRSPDLQVSPVSPITPPALLRAMQAALQARPEPTDIWVDAGNCVGWCLQYLQVDPPNRIFSALAMGPMGFGVAAAVGGKIGAPDRNSVAVVGDGAFLMYGAEVSTAAAHGVGAVWVVLNDNKLNMVSQGMQAFFPNEGPWADLYDLGAPDLAVVARGFGADAYDVTSPAEAAEAFAAAFVLAHENGKPQVIIAHIDSSLVPPYYPPSVG